MKTLIRLGSVVPNGVGGPEAGAIDLIYSFLLLKYEQNFYRYISINQIDEELQEFIVKEPGEKIHVNIRYSANKDFERLSFAERNIIRLDVIHSAMVRISDFDNKLDKEILGKIKEEIINKEFTFEIGCKKINNRNSKSLIAVIIVDPKPDKFDYYILIKKDNVEKCRVHLYSGLTNLYYFDKFFQYGKWKREDELIMTGKAKEVEIHLSIKDCSIKYVNLTVYEKPPMFEMFRSGLSEEEKDKAYSNWRSSLPPEINAVIDIADQSEAEKDA